MDLGVRQGPSLAIFIVRVDLENFVFLRFSLVFSFARNLSIV
jgi:hypothetical protein